jgi:hypothetical protein
MNKAKNKKPLREAIHKYRRVENLFEENITRDDKYEACFIDLNKITKRSVRAVRAEREYLENLYLRLYGRKAK